MARINLDLKCLALPERIAKVRQDAQTITTDQNNKEDVVGRLLTQLAAYVERVAGDDQRMIQSAGMDTRTQAGAASEAPSAPHGLSATAGDHDGEINLSWDTVAGENEKTSTLMDSFFHFKYLISEMIHATHFCVAWINAVSDIRNAWLFWKAKDLSSLTCNTRS